MNVYEGEEENGGGGEGAPGCQRANQPARAGINLPRAPKGISRLFSLYLSALLVALVFRPPSPSHPCSTLSRPSSRILNQTRDESRASIPARFIPGQTSASVASTRWVKVENDYKFTVYIYGKTYPDSRARFVLCRFPEPSEFSLTASIAHTLIHRF